MTTDDETRGKDMETLGWANLCGRAAVHVHLNAFHCLLQDNCAFTYMCQHAVFVVLLREGYENIELERVMIRMARRTTEDVGWYVHTQNIHCVS